MFVVQCKLGDLSAQFTFRAAHPDPRIALAIAKSEATKLYRLAFRVTPETIRLISQ
jgi:hypothetical protein